MTTFLGGVDWCLMVALQSSHLKGVWPILFPAYHPKRMNEILKQTHLGRGFGWDVFGGCLGCGKSWW